MSKRFEEIKDEYAIKLYPDHDYISNYETFKNYFASRHIDWFDSFNSEVSIRYAREVAQASLERAYGKACINLELCSYEYEALEQSITNPDNIVII